MPSSGAERLRAAVVVLGDLGRSPRMQNHALALAEYGVDVELIGDAGTPVYPELEQHPNLRIVRLARFAPRRAGRGGYLVGAALRAVHQTLQLGGRLLAQRPAPALLLVQNPPSVPTLLVAWLAARLRSARFVIDWHNYGYAMLGLRLGSNHPLVTIARSVEKALARRADAHLCVSAAMARDLANRFTIPTPTIVHDRPTRGFRAIDADARCALLRRLGESLALDFGSGSERRAVLVHPTSWTADEDVGLLLEALGRVAESCRGAAAQGSLRVPRFAVLITGQGPLRERFAAEIAARDCEFVRIRSAWLEPDDYRALLGSADLGLCVHRSASGVDLPMKIIDMLGAGLPVCALEYGPCLVEQLEPGGNALLFAGPEELADRLLELFREFPSAAPELDRMRENVRSTQAPSWEMEWTHAAAPVLIPRDRWPEDRRSGAQARL